MVLVGEGEEHRVRDADHGEGNSLVRGEGEGVLRLTGNGDELRRSASAAADGYVDSDHLKTLNHVREVRRGPEVIGKVERARGWRCSPEKAVNGGGRGVLRL